MGAGTHEQGRSGRECMRLHQTRLDTRPHRHSNALFLSAYLHAGLGKIDRQRRQAVDKARREGGGYVQPNPIDARQSLDVGFGHVVSPNLQHIYNHCTNHRRNHAGHVRLCSILSADACGSRGRGE